MPDENRQNKERSKISLRVGEVQVELEGTYDNIKKLMDKELVDFTKGLEKTAKPLPPSTESTPQVTPKAPEAAPKEKTLPPPSKPSIITASPSRVPTIGKKTEKISGKKIAWKTIAIALGMACIVLSAGLIGVLAIYLPMADDLNSQIADKNSNIAALNLQAASLNSQISALQDDLDQNASYIETLNEGIEYMNLQLQSYLNIIFMNVSESLPVEAVSQNASTSTQLFQGGINYAGYIVVSAQSTSNTTYVQLLYSSYGVDYDHNVTVTTSGTAYFPVLPGNVEIRVGNTDTYVGDFVNATATATYYY